MQHRLDDMPGGKYLALTNLLSASQLKWLALALMTLDHLAAYGRDIPVFAEHYSTLRLIGRLSMPIFLFVLAEGFIHTKSKWRFTLRLYIAGVLVGFLWLFPQFLWSEKWSYVYISSSSIIPTFFYIILYSTLIDTGIKLFKVRRLTRAAACFLVIPATLLIGPVRNVFFVTVQNAAQGAFLRSIFECFLPPPATVMYSLLIVGLGVVFCFCSSKYTRCAVFFCFSLTLYVIGSVSIGDIYTFAAINHVPAFFERILYDLADLTGHPQRYMFLALPFMALYSGKRGTAPKYFFYSYYPMHILVIQFVNKAARIIFAADSPFF